MFTNDHNVSTVKLSKSLPSTPETKTQQQKKRISSHPKLERTTLANHIIKNIYP